MDETFCYSVRIVQYKPGMRPYDRYCMLDADIQAMCKMGWFQVYSTHSMDHTATLYRRPAPRNSVDTYASQVANSPDPT